ncbi:MotA/TolQ/ExbB proton channel family protein [Novipirellula aureliae]|nr:MotA/TolQ/ExbB proton channel family protein [Novipirellula aureliae]
MIENRERNTGLTRTGLTALDAGSQNAREYQAIAMPEASVSGSPKRTLSSNPGKTALMMGVILAACLALSPRASAQPNSEIPFNEADIQDVMNDGSEEGSTSPPAADDSMHIDLLSLVGRGGGFMIPIGIMSLLVVALAVERVISLTRRKIVPKKFVREIEDMMETPAAFQPCEAFRICDDYPSPASSVVRGMLLRTGQPIGEIENAATEMIQREADRNSAPIRWLHLAAAATPLMGLLGTVWGMIVAFHESTTLTADRSRSEQLSEGIYTALVTTLAGLIVAIPAAILAQYLENRLAKLFHRVEDLAFELAPHMARFVGREQLDSEGNRRKMPPHSAPADAGHDGRGGNATPPPIAAGKSPSKEKSRPNRSATKGAS